MSRLGFAPLEGTVFPDPICEIPLTLAVADNVTYDALAQPGPLLLRQLPGHLGAPAQGAPRRPGQPADPPHRHLSGRQRGRCRIAASSPARLRRAALGSSSPEHAGDVLEEQADQRRPRASGPRRPPPSLRPARGWCSAIQSSSELLGGPDELVSDRHRGVVVAHDLAQHEPDEVLDLEHRLEHLVQEVRQLDLGRAVARGRGEDGQLVQEAPLGQHRHEQVLLGREVVVERGDVEAGGGGQVAHARAGDARAAP